MSGERSHQISIRIHRKLSRLSNTSNEHCIFKVHDELRRHNKQAYEPLLLSIGPYHHGKCNFKKMETYKLRYLQELLDRTREESADRYIVALTQLEDRARRCYAEEISLGKDEFLEMLCLDGLFVIEFLRKWDMPEMRGKDDTIFEMTWLLNCILRDLILFENQVPFSFLVELFDMTKFREEFSETKTLIHLALSLCCLIADYGSPKSCTINSVDEVIHLLDLVHVGWCSSFAAVPDEINDCENDFSLEFVKSASELGQSGIKFERAMQNESWLHIAFENGKVRIPRLTVEDSTEYVFRNLIAYEQYMSKLANRRYVTAYANFMDLLIDSPRDVEKLRHCQIITNYLGDDEFVSAMFNKLLRDICLDDNFSYLGVLKKVNKYSRKRRNIWKAHLMKNYFNTPWSIVSFLAAVVLLILTFVQTIFSILAVSKSK